MNENNDIIIYQTEDGVTQIEVRLENENVWLTQQQMADLYQTTRPNIVQHIRNIYEEGELEQIATCKNFLQVRQEGHRQVSREIPFYNLDMIISLGYINIIVTLDYFSNINDLMYSWISFDVMSYIGCNW